MNNKIVNVYKNKSSIFRKNIHFQQQIVIFITSSEFIDIPPVMDDDFSV
jgi:hypothetical protein